ncbi:hypothetical protein D3C74_318040 [compost metagenome]
MSASASAETSVGIFWYSACMMSGAPLPALTAVSSLVMAGSPPSCLLTVTWMSGFAAFQVSTTLSTFGAQVQKVSSTGPSAAGASEPPLPELQAVISSAAEAMIAAAFVPVDRRMRSSSSRNHRASRQGLGQGDSRQCGAVHGHSTHAPHGLVNIMFHAVT